MTVSSLSDVLKYFVEKTEYRHHPFMASQPYDTRIGEKRRCCYKQSQGQWHVHNSWQCLRACSTDVSPAPKCISLTSPTPKTVPQAQVAPMLRSQTKEELLPPPTKPVEGEYVVPDDDSSGDHKLKLGENERDYSP